MPSGIYERTEEWKRKVYRNSERNKKISLAIIGRKCPWNIKRNLENNPMKNKEISKKMSETRKIRIKSGKIYIWNKRLKYDERRKILLSETVYKNKERNKKISNALKGRKKDSESVKRQRNTLKKLYKDGILKPNLGAFKKGDSRLSDINIRKKAVESWKKHFSQGLFIAPRSGKKQSERWLEMRKNLILPKQDTSIEVKIQNFLKELNINFFTHQYMKEIEHGYQCDILIPSINLIIECDGNYWHKYPTGRDIDHIRTSELIEKGFKVLRLWEFEIKQMDINKFQERII